MIIIRYRRKDEFSCGSADSPGLVTFADCEIHCPSRLKEYNEEIAKAEAYNGEYTIEDDGKPEPVIPPTNAELAAENKLLKKQVSALTDQQSFYEDCIAEMAEVVYA